MKNHAKSYVKNPKLTDEIRNTPPPPRNTGLGTNQVGSGGRALGSQGNRGMALEQLINYTNRVYTEKGLAVVNKRPTPVKILRLRGNKITDAYLEAASTVDYEGCYRGHSLQFEAKSTKQTTRFDLDNVHKHQVEHMRRCMSQGALCFVVLEFSQLQEIFYLPGQMLVKAWDERKDGRKSIANEDIARLCYLIPSTRGVPVDYLSVVDKLLVHQEEAVKQ